MAVPLLLHCDGGERIGIEIRVAALDMLVEESMKYFYLTLSTRRWLATSDCRYASLS